VNNPRVVIIGGGLGGLIAAIKLKEAGRDFVLLERNPAVGGTWYANSYPGCACDVPVVLYQLSFAPSANWSRVYPQAAEIQAYAEELVARYDLGPHLRLGEGATAAQWDDTRKVWKVTTAAGEVLEAGAVIGALGQLSRPALPDIPGRDTFAGPAMHTAQWNHSVDYAGKRVGVIGCAASAIQAIPELAKTAAHVTVFQRTPNWLVPRLDEPISDEMKALLASQPEAAARVGELNRSLWFERADTLTWHAFSFTPEGRAAFTRVALDHLEAQVSDPELRRKLTPDYPIGCKRVLISDDYYPALQRDNVTLETTPIRAITEGGIETTDGVEHACDMLVYATGFNTTDWRWSVEVTGTEGSLNEAWSHGAEAYKGVTVAGFPNLFLLYGPNTNLGHNSITYMMEAQVGYIMQALEHMDTAKIAALAPTPEAQTAYNEQLQRDLNATVWGDPACGSSWYKNAEGKITQNWSGSAREFADMLAAFDTQGFEVYA
jgi:cation diffusion facilitator CzcD-associated flavoprotein CzcO